MPKCPDRAETELRRSLGILETLLGPSHGDLLPVLADLADLLADQDRHAEAEAAYQRTLELLRATRPASHPDVVATLARLALLADLQDRGDPAESLYRQAITLADDSEQESIELATALHNLASIYHRQDRLDEAEPLYRRALDLRRRLLGNNHWVVAESLSDLALLLYRRGRADEARGLTDRAADLLQPYCGALNAEADGVRRSARELCRDTRTLQQRLARAAAEPPPGKSRVPEPTPESVRVEAPSEAAVYRVQLAARKDPDEARRELEKLRRRHPELLGRLASHLETADLGRKGTWYRLQFGAFRAYDPARTLCDELLRAGEPDCWVAGP